MRTFLILTVVLVVLALMIEAQPNKADRTARKQAKQARKQLKADKQGRKAEKGRHLCTLSV